MLKRISIHHAKRLFADGDSIIILCPCKMRPSGPWSMGCRISGKEYQGYSRGTDEKFNLDVAWELMYNNWAYYNTGYECGYYAHYYIES